MRRRINRALARGMGTPRAVAFFVEFYEATLSVRARVMMRWQHAWGIIKYRLITRRITLLKFQRFNAIFSSTFVNINYEGLKRVILSRESSFLFGGCSWESIRKRESEHLLSDWSVPWLTLITLITQFAAQDACSDLSHGELNRSSTPLLISVTLLMTRSNVKNQMLNSQKQL